MTASWLAEIPASDGWRSVMAADALRSIGPAAAWAGITRVAELTHLDEIGMPVFQAIRPMSRALSVHQGKGANDIDARLSAIMEAIESCAAENAQAGDVWSALGDVPCGKRSSRLADYGRQHCGAAASHETQINWTIAEDIAGGGEIFVPHDLVTLDFTSQSNAGYIRTSLGLAAGVAAEDATAAALYELIEREAQARWLASGMIGQAIDRVDTQTIDLAWVRAASDHLAALGLRLSIYAKYGIGRLPVAICRIDEPGVAPSFAGAACRADPADALLRAFGEAVQSRLTMISGARDDIEPDDPARPGARALGTPPGFAGINWRAYCGAAATTHGCDFMLAALADAGIKHIARIDLSPPFQGISVVKLIAPGLASSPEQCA